MYENASVSNARSWVQDWRTREGALFYTSVAAILLDVMLASLVAAGLVDAGLAATFAASWTAGLTALGTLIRGEVYSAQSAHDLERQAYIDGRRVGLDVASPVDRPDGYGTTGGC